MSGPTPTRTDGCSSLHLGATGCRSERGRRYASLILTALNNAGRESAGDFLGVDKSTVTRFANEHLDKMCDLLAFLEIKCVPQEYQCYKRSDVEAFMHLAKERMAQLNSTDSLELEWDD